jgi:hypothetical protein
MRQIVVACGVLLGILVPVRPAVADAAVRGTLQRIPAETPGAAELAVVVTGDRRVAVPAAAVQGIPAGSQVEVRAPQTDGEVRATGAVDVRVTEAAADPDLLGTHQVVVLPVYWRTPALPAGSPTAAELTASIQRADDYYDAVSDGRIRFAVDRVQPWRKITLGASSPEVSCPHHAIEEAARAGAGTLPVGVRRHVVVYFPYFSGCDWAGLANLGSSPYTDTTIWLNGDTSLQVFAHEIGHNLGLRHANGSSCRQGEAGPVVPYGSVCASAFYNDLWDVMGNRAAGHLAAVHLDELGLLPPAANAVVTGSGQVRLAPLTSGAGLRQLTIPIGARTVFVEYRTAAGLDGWIDDDTTHLGEPDPGGGVLVRFRDAGWPYFRAGEIDLVNFSADSIESDLRGLQAGQSWQASDGTLGFEVVSADATGATVNLTVAADTSAPEPFGITGPADGDVAGNSEVDVSWDATTDDGTGLAGYRVEVDGVDRATVPADTGTYAVPGLPDGVHHVRVLASDLSGNVRATAKVRFSVDTVAPAVTGPRPALRRGPVSPSGVPVTVTWTAHDAGGLASQWLVRYGVSATPAATATRSVPTTARLGRAEAWIVTATDPAGNERQARGPAVRAAFDNPVTGYRGRWSTVRSSRYLGRSERVTTRRGAALDHTVTARSAGLIATTGPDRGWADVYVDGRRSGSVNLYRSATATRQQVWTCSWATAGRHRITVVNRATPGRPLIGIDAVSRLS